MEFLGPQTVSFVERFIIQCPYFGGSTIGGSTVFINYIVVIMHQQDYKLFSVLATSMVVH